jgi:hypothetical protein
MRPSISCALLALAVAVPAAAAPDAKKSAPADDAAQIADKLLQRMDVGQRMEKVPFRDVLQFLHEKTGLTYLLDLKPLRDSGVEPVIEDAAVTVPAMSSVRVETVLRHVLDQLDLDFTISPDHVRITTALVKDTMTGNAQSLPNLYPGGEDNPPQVERKEVIRNTPFVTAAFREVTTADALKDVAARAGRTIVVSAPAAEKAKAQVTLTLANVPFETAAAALAEAAGLRAFRTGNVVVVVTAERAKQVEAAGQGAGIGIGCPVPESRLATPEQSDRLRQDLSRADDERKALEEKVRKLTEELEKSKKK